VAIKNTAWSKVEAGQIVDFVYKSKNDTKGTKRTVIIVSSDYKYRKKSTGRIKRFVVGLQIDRVGQRPIPKGQLNEIFKNLGGMELEEGAFSADLPDNVNKNKIATEKLYTRLKALVKKYNMWRTYDRRECMKRRVYLQMDYDRIPKPILKSFEKEQTTQITNMMENED
tara:strand:- start:698 stop:1204 length:507 start_codon:yes stop_codon:yes gene_type:complete